MCMSQPTSALQRQHQPTVNTKRIRYSMLMETDLQRRKTSLDGLQSLLNRPEPPQVGLANGTLRRFECIHTHAHTHDVCFVQRFTKIEAHPTEKHLSQKGHAQLA